MQLGATHDEEEFFHLEPLESEEINIGFSEARSINLYKDLVQDSNTQDQAILKEIDEAGWSEALGIRYQHQTREEA